MKPSRLIIATLLIATIALVSYFGDAETEDQLWWVPTSAVKLYFATPSAKGLEAEVRWLRSSESTPEARLRALIDGPRDASLVSTIPSTAEVLSVELVNGTIVADFNDLIVRDHAGGTTGEMLTVFSIVNTLTEIDGVDSVLFTVEGMPMMTLAGHLDLSGPVTRDETLIISSHSF